jgi:hypothetical protein
MSSSQVLEFIMLANYLLSEKESYYLYLAEFCDIPYLKQANKQH